MENSESDMRLLRLPDVARKLGVCRATLYNKIKEGIFPVPVGIGTRSVAWPSYEVDAMIRFMVAGMSKRELSEQSRKLVGERRITEGL